MLKTNSTIYHILSYTIWYINGNLELSFEEFKITFKYLRWNKATGICDSNCNILDINIDAIDAIKQGPQSSFESEGARM